MTRRKPPFKIRTWVEVEIDSIPCAATLLRYMETKNEIYKVSRMKDTFHNAVKAIPYNSEGLINWADHFLTADLLRYIYPGILDKMSILEDRPPLDIYNDLLAIENSK